jgi:superfamily II DNA or RNA helicase
MSARIKRNLLTKAQLGNIARLLVMQPKQRYMPSNNFYARQNTKEPIKLFEVDTDTDEVIVPYTFYRGISTGQPNADKRFPQVPYNFKGELYESQQSIADDAMDQLNTHGTTTLNLYTAFGKTVLGAYLASKLNMLTLVLYTSTILEPQWKNTFEQFTDVRVWIVGQAPPPEGAHVILCMDTRLSKMPKEYIDQIGTVIYDEAHEFCTPTRVSCFLGIQPRYIISATATLKREDGMHDIIQAVCGTHSVVKISKKPFNVFKYITGIDIPLQKNARNMSDWPKYCRDLCENEDRNIMILDIVRRNPSHKILILTWRKDHVDLLHKCLTKMEISVDMMAGNKKSYNDSRVLVGTISKIGTGFDEKAACDDFNGVRINMLILVGSMKSVQLLEQVAGRCFRADFPQIIFFVDDSNISENHWKVAQRWFISRNGQIFETKTERATALEESSKSEEDNSSDISSAHLAKIQQKVNLTIVENPSTSNIGNGVIPEHTSTSVPFNTVHTQAISVSSTTVSENASSTVNAQLSMLRIKGFIKD